MIGRAIIAALGITIIVISAGGSAIAQQLDSESQQRVITAILQQLDPYALHLNNQFYTSFQISGAPPPSQPEGGFVQPLMPQGAPLVRNGLMEITPFDRWSFALLPDERGGWRGVVSLRLYKYRVFVDGRGWSPDNLLQLHFWEWNVTLDDSGIHASVKMDTTNFPTDNGPRELVASVYNVPPPTVAVGRPNPDAVAQVLSSSGGSPGSSQMPVRRGCRPCEVQQPDGSCKQWRAC
jgi:hypothetical protein